MIARRCLPEVFGNDLDFGRAFAARIRAAGVTELVIEGRIKSHRSVNALAGIDDEIALMSGEYELCRRYRNVAYMRARDGSEGRTPQTG